MNWVAAYESRAAGRVENTYTADYRLRDLMRKNAIDRAAAQRFLDDSGCWISTGRLPGRKISRCRMRCVDRMADVQGYALFVHGWTGNLHIWEDLPGMVVESNRQLVSIAIDHNGFGASLFVDETPSLDSCNPPAAMRTLHRSST